MGLFVEVSFVRVGAEGEGAVCWDEHRWFVERCVFLYRICEHCTGWILLAILGFSLGYLRIHLRWLLGTL